MAESQNTQKVKFVADASYDGGGLPVDAREFKAGKVYDLSPASASRWVRRRKAEYVLAEGTPRPDAVPVRSAPAVDAPAAPVLSAAEERAARGPLPGELPAAVDGVAGPSAEAVAGESEDGDVKKAKKDAKADGDGPDALTTKEAKAVTAAPRDKAVKPSATRKK